MGPMGSIIEGAAAGDFAGSSVGLSEKGQVLLVPSRGSDSRRGSVQLFVWSSDDWEQRGGVLVGSVPAGGFGIHVALSGDGTVVAAANSSGSGVRVIGLTAERVSADDAACQTAYNDTAAYVASLGVCSGEGSMDVCVVCTGGGYPIGRLGACGVCLAGEYRHATSYTCDPCPADSAECYAVFGSAAGLLDVNVTCGGLVSGCVRRPPFGGGSPQCSPGYYGDTRDRGACVLCTGHTVGSVQRGDPVPADENVSANDSVGPESVALSVCGSVLAVGFPGESISGVGLVGVVRVYSWSGVSWVQRGDDVEGVATEGGFGFDVELRGDGMVVAVSAPFASNTGGSSGGDVAVFAWDENSWSQRGSTIAGEQPLSVLGLELRLSALGSVLVLSEFYEVGDDYGTRAAVYVWDTDTSDWVLRGAPVGSGASESYGVSVAMSSDGDVVAIGSRGPSVGLDEGIICVYEWESGNSQYEVVGNCLVGVVGERFGAYGSLALSGDGLVLAAGVSGRGTNGDESGGVRVFGRYGQEWVPMGSIIEGASSGDLAGIYVALSEDGHILLVPSRGGDSNRGSLLLYVWTSEDWDQRGGVIAGPYPRGQFGVRAVLSGDGTVVAAVSSFGSGVRVFDLTAERLGVDDAACMTAYNDTAAYVASVDVCSGTGTVDVCVVCEGGGYPIVPSRDCGVCLAESTGTQGLTLVSRVLRTVRSATLCLGQQRVAGWQRHLWWAGEWVRETSSVRRGSPQCSAGYYGDARDGGTCVLCTGHSVGAVMRGAPVPADELAAADVSMNPTSVAVSGFGAVLALGFSDAGVGGVEYVGVVRVYSWSGVAWEQRGDDIESVATEGDFGFDVVLSEDGMVVAASAPFANTGASSGGVVAVFAWEENSWSQRGSRLLVSRNAAL